MWRLPSEWWHEAWSGLSDGRFVTLGVHPDDSGEYVRELVWLGEGDAIVDPVAHMPVEAFADHEPFLVALPHGACAIIAGPSELWVHRDAGSDPVRVPIGGAELLAAVAPHPRLQGGCAVSDDSTFAVVLSHGVLTQERRYVADLAIDTERLSATWTSEPRTLRPDDFPHDRFGDTAFDDDGEQAVSLTASLRADGRLTICSEGSDLGSMNRYGSDFFTVASVSPDGAVVERRWEDSGWKRQPGKHGIHGRFTADGEHAILTPNFGTGAWEGQQRVLRLRDGRLLAPRFPRGRSKASILDCSGERWWIEHEGELLAVDEIALVEV